MKMLLIATTALVCVTSLAMAGTLPERQPGSGNGGLNANEEFLCNYGFRLYSDSHNSGSFWKRAATPVIGKGTPVNEIIVEDGRNGAPYPVVFRIAIYTSQHDKPEKEIVSASAGQWECGHMMVPISPITLEKGKKYWIVQSAKAVSSSEQSNSIVWLYDTKRTHGALSQSGWWTSGVNHHGPWTPITGGVPYALVRESAGTSEKPNRPPQPHGAGDGSISPVAFPARRSGQEGNIARYPP